LGVPREKRVRRRGGDCEKAPVFLVIGLSLNEVAWTRRSKGSQARTVGHPGCTC